MKDYTNPQVKMLIDEHVHSERNRALLKRKLIDGVKYEALAEEFDLSTQWVKEIVGNFRREYL